MVQGGSLVLRPGCVLRPRLLSDAGRFSAGRCGVRRGDPVVVAALRRSLRRSSGFLKKEKEEEKTFILRKNTNYSVSMFFR